MASHIGNGLSVKLHDTQTGEIKDITRLVKSCSFTTQVNSVAFANTSQATRPIEFSVSRLELMGFDDSERQRIASIAMALGQSAESLGELLMSFQSIPRMPFVFQQDFDWCKAWLLTAVLVLVAVVVAG